MRKFMDRDFLLSNGVAKRLYHEFAEDMPIVDYHCHIDPREIWEDRRFDNITQAWLEGDHYKWRLMRSGGVEERFITGDATDREKFQKWAETLETAIGNPLYHWSHLELRTYFGYEGILNGDTADDVWNICNGKLKSGELSVRDIIKRSDVRIICTTDDPADTLEWHEKIRDDGSFDVEVLPAWRPDAAMNIADPDYKKYLRRLEEASGVGIKGFGDLVTALKVRMDAFGKMGCRISDHGMGYVIYEPASYETVEEIFRRRLSGEAVSRLEERRFVTAFMIAMGRAYHERDWAMQLHYGVRRNNNCRLFESVGPDAGADCIGDYVPLSEMTDYLDALDKTDELPRTVIYGLNPADNAAIGSIIGCFQDSSAVGKMQHGSAWWFNDNIRGIKDQLTSLANLGLLGNFIGMLTDSRSFLSYTRHDYFRRILCDLIGGWVENGEYPEDYAALEKIVRGICHDNAVRYFGFGKRGR